MSQTVYCWHLYHTGWGFSPVSPGRFSRYCGCRTENSIVMVCRSHFFRYRRKPSKGQRQRQLPFPFDGFATATIIYLYRRFFVNANKKRRFLLSFSFARKCQHRLFCSVYWETSTYVLVLDPAVYRVANHQSADAAPVNRLVSYSVGTLLRSGLCRVESDVEQ